MNKHSNFGFSSILISFIMICIVTFSALSVLTANADYKLSKKVAMRNALYYEAEEEAYETLTHIDQTLADCFATSQNSAEYFSLVREALTDGNWKEGANGVLSYSYTIPMEDSQFLEITLEPTYPIAQTGTYYSISGWKTIIPEPDSEEQPLNLMGLD